MLNGIHVLNKVIEKDIADWVAIALLLTFLFTLIIGVICVYLEKEEKLLAFVGIGIVGVIIMGIIMFIGVFTQEPTGEYTYQVTIDKNVSMTEFNNKYDIIKQEGEIYYIRERNDK